MYLCTHDGYLFFTSASQALPPNPPGLPLSSKDSTDLRRNEVTRGCQQIMRASGVTDLRNIASVRRAFQVVPHQTDDVPVRGNSVWDDSDEFWAHPESYEDDHNDVGGEEGLNAAPDRIQRRVRRSFELLLTSGRVIRFEVCCSILRRA